MAKFNLKKLKIKAEHIIEFPQGLIGFSGAKRFVLIDERGSKRFMWLTSVDQPNLSFLVVNPKEVISDYEIEIPQNEMDFLGLKSTNDVEAFVIVTLPENAWDATVNLRSPILINPEKRLGKQVILEQGRYPVQYAVLREKDITKVGSRS